MPEAGTKAIEIGGRTVFLPADDVELEDLVRAGLDAQARKDEASAELEQLKDIIIKRAEARRSGQKTVNLVAPLAGEARVTWSTEFVVDPVEARRLEDELPASIFVRIFSKSVKYSPARGLRSFMRTPQTKEMDKIKALVAKAYEFRPKRPSVKFVAADEAASSPAPADAEDDET